MFIIRSLQSSVQRELDDFFRDYNKKLLPERFVGQSAFSQARLKIKPNLFIELRNYCNKHFYSNYEQKKWNNYRLVAIDGTEVCLPKTEETISEFGEYTTNLMSKTIVLARASKAYDVLNKINIDAKMVNRKIGEHTLANQHLEHCTRGDLMLFDRGYPSFDLFKNILATGSQFCARVTAPCWNVAKSLVESGQKEMVKEIMPGHDLTGKYKKLGITVKPIKCRFVCITLSSGEKEVLITSLIDEKKYPHSVFMDLYHMRWDIEESYKKDKHRLQLENFSGKTIIAIYQDFYATMLLENIASILSIGSKDGIDKRKGKTKYEYQINYTTALAKVKNAIAILFSRKNILKILESIINMIWTNTLPVREGRSFRRNFRHRRRYHKTYLPL